MKNLTLVIPAKKEKESLPKVINELKNYDLKILVVLEKNNLEIINSISNFNCQLVFQKKKGYGDEKGKGCNLVYNKLFCIINDDDILNLLNISYLIK